MIRWSFRDVGGDDVYKQNPVIKVKEASTLALNGIKNTWSKRR